MPSAGDSQPLLSGIRPRRVRPYPLSELPRLLRVQVALTITGGVVAALGYGVAIATAPAIADAGPYLAAVWTAEAHSSGLWEVVGSGGFAVAVIGLCLLVCRTPLRWVAIPLRAVGSMPLTAYVLQIAVWAVFAAVALGDTSDLAGVRDAGLFLPLTLGIVVGCTLWALLVGRGPLEAVIDGVVRRVVGPGSRTDAAPAASATCSRSRATPLPWEISPGSGTSSSTPPPRSGGVGRPRKPAHPSRPSPRLRRPRAGSPSPRRIGA